MCPIAKYKLTWVNALIAFGLLGQWSTATGQDYSGPSVVDGFSQPYRVSVVAAPTSGVVSERSVREGEEVTQGQLLAKIDDSVHLQAMEVARISSIAKGDEELAKIELKSQLRRLHRLEELSRRDSATDAELELAREQVARAHAQISVIHERRDQREADYRRLLAESKLFSISAPFDGVVVEYHRSVGEFVSSVQPDVCTVADLNKLSVVFLVPQSIRNQLKLGEETKVRFVRQRDLVSGVVDYISPFPDGETNLFTVKIVVENSQRTLQAGQLCQLRPEGPKKHQFTSKQNRQ